MPVQVNWKPCTHDRYWYNLEVLPPIYGPNGFLVSEPYDHRKCESTGHVLPRYDAFIEMKEGEFFEADRPLTVFEFRDSNRP